LLKNNFYPKFVQNIFKRYWLLVKRIAILQEERKCTYGRIEKLLRIRCYDLDLKEVPQNLKTSVEVSNDRGVRRSRRQRTPRHSWPQLSLIKE